MILQTFFVAWASLSIAGNVLPLTVSPASHFLTRRRRLVVVVVVLRRTLTLILCLAIIYVSVPPYKIIVAGVIILLNIVFVCFFGCCCSDLVFNHNKLLFVEHPSQIRQDQRGGEDQNDNEQPLVRPLRGGEAAFVGVLLLAVNR